jgi:hypothetical protein
VDQLFVIASYSKQYNHGSIINAYVMHQYRFNGQSGYSRLEQLELNHTGYPQWSYSNVCIKHNHD